MRGKFLAVSVPLFALLLLAHWLSAQAIPERLRIRGMVFVERAGGDGKPVLVPGATVTAYQGGQYSPFLNCLLNPLENANPKDCKERLRSEYSGADPVPVQTVVTGADGSFAFVPPKDLPDRDTLVVAEIANAIGAGLVPAHGGRQGLAIRLRFGEPRDTKKKPCPHCAVEEKLNPE
jgi:hypothetical protein